jgi:rhodanese-related sulfurtransferase
MPEGLEVSTEETARALADASARVVDVREPYEREAGYVEGTEHHALSGAGFDAYSMAGGVQQWAEEGRPLSPDGGHVADH